MEHCVIGSINSDIEIFKGKVPDDMRYGAEYRCCTPAAPEEDCSETACRNAIVQKPV